MPYIEPKYDKEGNLTHYRLTVSNGLNWKGQQIRRRKTWKPSREGMTEKQMEKAAMAAAFKFEESLKAGFEIDKTYKFHEYAEYVLDLKKRNGLSATTIERYQSMLPRINDAIGHIKLGDLRPYHLNDLYKDLSENGVCNKGAVATAKKVLAKKVKAVKEPKYKIAEAAGISHTTLNAILKGDAVRAENKEADYFQPEEMEDILKALQNAPLKWKAMTYILIDTGCRRGELMGLQWNCLDLDKGIMMIKQALLYTKEKGVYLGNTKTSRPRAVCIAPETVAVLKQYKTEQLRNKILHADIWQDTGFVFTKDDGTAMHPDSITDWLNKFSEENDLPHIHPHAFRHTAASTMIANGVDIVTTAAELGHATATTTANIYLRPPDRQSPCRGRRRPCRCVCYVASGITENAPERKKLRGEYILELRSILS